MPKGVEAAIRRHVAPGERLLTPMKGAPFVVKSIGSDGVVLLLGAGEAATKLSWDCLEGVVPFLEGKGLVEIGSRYETEGREGTLDAYLKGYLTRATAGWVASLLEKAKVVEIVRGRPGKVRLAPRSPVPYE